MTLYILHGGNTSFPDSRNDHFFAHFTKSVNKNDVTILLCYFSRERSTWDSLIERDTTEIRNQTNKKVDILVAENPKDLFKKLERSDVLYVAGGDAELIEPLYTELKALKTQLTGKVYIGSSMGAFLVSERYVLSYDSQDSETVHFGLGLLPIQTLCHWDVEDKKEYKINLLSQDSELPIIPLDECETVVMYRK